MTKEKTKRREWVKNAIIIFLAVMLLLTFFSNTIMNRSLPVVSSQYPKSGTITAKIRGTGTVSSNEVYNVTVDQTREVQAVAVRQGDTVVAGQVLFVLADRESDELKAAAEALDAAKYAYETFLLDVSATDSNVQSAQQALAKAKNARDKAYSDYTLAHGSGVSGTALSEAQTAYNTAKAKAESAKLAYEQAELELTKATANLEQLEGELTAEQEALKKPLDDATKQLENAQLLLDSASTEKAFQEEKLGMTYEAAVAAVDTASETLSDIDDQIYEKQRERSSVLSDKSKNDAMIDTYWDVFEVYYDEAVSTNIDYRETIENLNADLQAAIDTKAKLESELAKTEDDEKVKQLITAIEDEVDNITYIQSQLDDYITSADAAGYITKIEALYAENETLNDELVSISTELSSLNSQYNKAYEDYSDAKAVLSDSALLAAMEDYEDAAQQVKEYQLKVNEATIAYNNALPTDTPEVSAAKQALTQATNNKNQAEYNNTAAQSALATAQEKLEELKNAATAESDLSSYDDAVSDAQIALSAAIESADISDAKEELDLLQKKKAVEDAQAEVDRLTADASPVEVVSKYNGIVTAVNVVSGDKTDPSIELATIEVAEKGYTMTLTVTSEQARKVSIGDKAELTNYWSYGNMDITLVSVTSDRDSQGQNKILTFAVEGEEVIPGQSLSISIGQKSESYDAIIPNSAVREDSAGKFVYVVQSKSSPLGNRYIAKRLDVSVLASDDTNSAVSGLSSSEFVIVSSTAPIEGGQQVRLSEE